MILKKMIYIAIGSLLVVGALLSAYLLYNYGASEAPFSNPLAIAVWLVIGIIIILIKPVQSRL